MQRFGTEAQCRAALFALRWGKGWVCPACGHGRCAELKSRALYSCNRCKHQVGLTAGTVFHWTKLPLTTWFLAIYHLTQSKGGMSSVELARRLGTRQPTAWLMKQKLMAAMAAARRRQAQARRPGRGRRRLSRRRAPGRQARPRCRRQDPVRRRGRDDGRAQAAPAAADGRQRLPQERDRGAGQARLRRRQQRRQRRPELLDRGRAGRLHALPDGHRQRARRPPNGRPSNGSTRPSATSRPRSPAPTITSARSTPSATSPASPGASTAATSSTPDRAPRLRLRPDGAASLPGHHRRMNEADNQETDAWAP